MVQLHTTCSDSMAVKCATGKLTRSSEAAHAGKHGAGIMLYTHQIRKAKEQLLIIHLSQLCLSYSLGLLPVALRLRLRFQILHILTVSDPPLEPSYTVFVKKNRT